MAYLLAGGLDPPRIVEAILAEGVCVVLYQSGHTPRLDDDRPEVHSDVNNNAEDGFLGKLIPGNFRDMDFVFRCQGGKSPSGKQVYKQMLLLCYRWEQYNLMLKKETAPNQLKVSKLGVFTNEETAH